MLLSWLIVLAWIAVAVVAGVVAWFITDQIARRIVKEAPPAEAPPPRARRTRR